jgi:putative holliday junction resolvase
MKILGIDYGSKRVGIAISDESHTLAREYNIFSPKEFWEQIEKLCKEEEVGKIVIGLPLNMSGGHTDTTRSAQEFADKLEEKLGIAVEYMDERLSSVMAGNLPGGKKNVDSLAAQIILQNYLDKTKA